MKNETDILEWILWRTHLFLPVLGAQMMEEEEVVVVVEAGSLNGECRIYWSSYHLFW